MSGKPHRHAAAIVAWATGKEVKYRRHMASGAWTPWVKCQPNHHFDDSISVEYQVVPEGKHHKWQKEKEAWLAGIPVEFCNQNYQPDVWHSLTAANGCSQHTFDNAWLTFRIGPARTEKQVNVNRAGYITSIGKANLKLVWVGDHLTQATVLP